MTRRTKSKPKRFVYLIRGGAFCKIGSSNNPLERLKELQVGNPFDLELVSAFCGTRADETHLHNRFKHRKTRSLDKGEWFKWHSRLPEFWNLLRGVRGGLSPEGGEIPQDPKSSLDSYMFSSFSDLCDQARTNMYEVN